MRDRLRRLEALEQLAEERGFVACTCPRLNGLGRAILTARRSHLAEMLAKFDGCPMRHSDPPTIYRVVVGFQGGDYFHPEDTDLHV
jgi:hypothetical protein